MSVPPAILEGSMKTCAKCHKSLPVSSFGKHSKWRDGLFPYCRTCKNAASAQSHAKHREARNAQKRAAYPARRTEYLARAKRSYEADREGRKAYIVEWQAANIEKVRRYKAKHTETHREAKRENWRRRHARKLAASVVPFALADLEAKIDYWGRRCWICQGPYEAVDHVKPLAKGGLHVLANLRPICTACNTRKRDRWPLAS